MSAKVDLKSLGINQEPEWWETILKYGMIFAALFQIICIAYAICGPEKDSDGKVPINNTTSQRYQKAGPNPSREATVISGRKRTKQDKKRH